MSNLIGKIIIILGAVLACWLLCKEIIGVFGFFAVIIIFAVIGIITSTLIDAHNYPENITKKNDKGFLLKSASNGDNKSWNELVDYYKKK